jgi:hypothetical protein
MPCQVVRVLGLLVKWETYAILDRVGTSLGRVFLRRIISACRTFDRNARPSYGGVRRNYLRGASQFATRSEPVNRL